MQIAVLETLRQPEYTGENRCEPCTMLNLIIAAIFGSVIARKSKLGGAIAVGISIVLIYLRGYLVPGTPTVTKRYLPPAVLRWFGKDPEQELATGIRGDNTAPQPSSGDQSQSTTQPTSAVADESKNGGGRTPESESGFAEEELETFFLVHDILEPCTDADDLCLTDEFEADWTTATEPLVDSDISGELVVETLGIKVDDQEKFELFEQNEVLILQSEGRWVGQWPSRAALIADLAASRVLQSWVPKWNNFGSEEQGPILNGLRMFLETCPTTGGNVQLGEEVVESCCSSHKVIAVSCEDSGERLFEHQLPDSE
jgi:hypothetical protein